MRWPKTINKVNKIESYLLILLIHLIKQRAENRTTKSWNQSTDNSLGGIAKSNKRRSAGGYYLRPEEFRGVVDETFSLAVRNAA